MMKKVLLSVVVLGMLTSCACSGLKVKYSKTDPKAMHERDLKGFERIEQLGAIDVKYAQADSFSVRVEAPVNVLDDVETRVYGSKLVVNMKGSNKIINFGVSKSDGVTVYVTSPDFLGIELKGSGDFVCEGLLDTDTLDILLRGSGDIDFENIICDRVNVSVVGSGDVDVKNVKTIQSSVELIGSGDIKMWFDNSGSVESHLTGSGDIKLGGNVLNFKSSVRGSGDMEVSELSVKN